MEKWYDATFLIPEITDMLSLTMLAIHISNTGVYGTVTPLEMPTHDTSHLIGRTRIIVSILGT
jgi:hypothetical protein